MNRRVELAGDRPRPSPRTIGLGALALLALLAAGWFALFNSDSAAGDDPTATPTAAPTDEPAPPATTEPSPTDTTTPDDEPVDPLDELTFVDYAGIDLPVHPTAGPTDVETNGRATGFEDSELGAALAAVHLSIRGSGAGPLDVVGATIEQQFVENDDRNRLLAEATRANSEEIEEGELVGYRVTQFSPGESATVEILALSRGAFGFTAVELVHIGGEWKAQPPPQGLWTNAITAPAEPDGFTIWKDF